jgi:hypothetical protein
MRLERGRRSILPLLEYLRWTSRLSWNLLKKYIPGLSIPIPHKPFPRCPTSEITATLHHHVRLFALRECPIRKACSIRTICECLFQHPRWLKRHKKFRAVFRDRLAYFIDMQGHNYAARLWTALCATSAERTTELLRDRDKSLKPIRQRLRKGMFLCLVSLLFVCVVSTWWMSIILCVVQLPVVCRAICGLLRWRAHRKVDALLQYYHCIPYAPSWRTYCLICIYGTGKEIKPADLYLLGGADKFASSIVTGRLPGFFRPLRLLASQTDKQLDPYECAQSRRDVVAASVSLKLVHVICTRHRLPSALLTHGILPFFRQSSRICGIIYGLECDGWEKGLSRTTYKQTTP